LQLAAVEAEIARLTASVAELEAEADAQAAEASKVDERIAEFGNKKVELEAREADARTRLEAATAAIASRWVISVNY
jgi:hypothetical protein